MESQKKIARLESRLDYLETEISQINDLLLECGFEEGLATLKEAALQILREEAS